MKKLKICHGGIHLHTKAVHSQQPINKSRRNAPIKDGGGDNVGMGLGPRGVLEKIARGTLLLEVLVGYRAGEAGLAIVIVGLDAAHAANAAEAGGVAAGRTGQVADGGGRGEHGSDYSMR